MENTHYSPVEGAPPKRARFDYSIESDSDNDSLLPSDSESTTSYDSEGSMPDLGEAIPNQVFNEEEEPNLPPPPLPPEDNNSNVPSPTGSTHTEYNELLPSPRNITPTTQFSLFNQAQNQNNDSEKKDLKTLETNQAHKLLKTLGLVSAIGLSAFSGISYGLSLIIPQLHTILATLSILQIGALFFGMEFLIISATLMAVNYMNTKNESIELSDNSKHSNPSL